MKRKQKKQIRRGFLRKYRHELRNGAEPEDAFAAAQSSIEEEYGSLDGFELFIKFLLPLLLSFLDFDLDFEKDDD